VLIGVSGFCIFMAALAAIGVEPIHLVGGVAAIIGVVGCMILLIELCMLPSRLAHKQRGYLDEWEALSSSIAYYKKEDDGFRTMDLPPHDPTGVTFVEKHPVDPPVKAQLKSPDTEPTE